MKLWLISQTANTDYDTYDSAVVAAETAKAARHTHPNGASRWHDGSWYSGEWGRSTDHSWAAPDRVTVEYIGETDRQLASGTVLCSSFNAG